MCPWKDRATQQNSVLKNKKIYYMRTGKIAFYPVKILGSKPDAAPGTYVERE